MPLFNTVGEQITLECHIRKEIKFRYGRKFSLGSNKEPYFKSVSNKEFSDTRLGKSASGVGFRPIKAWCSFDPRRTQTGSKPSDTVSHEPLALPSGGDQAPAPPPSLSVSLRGAPVFAPLRRDHPSAREQLYRRRQRRGVSR